MIPQSFKTASYGSKSECCCIIKISSNVQQSACAFLICFYLLNTAINQLLMTVSNHGLCEQHCGPCCNFSSRDRDQGTQWTSHSVLGPTTPYVYNLGVTEEIYCFYKMKLTILCLPSCCKFQIQSNLFDRFSTGDLYNNNLLL